MSAHPIGVCGCKGTKKIAYAQGLCDFFGVECKGGAICQTTGKSKTGGGIIREIPKYIFGKINKHLQRKVVVAGY